VRSSIFISAVNNQHIHNLDTQYHAKRKKHDYTIIKVRTRERVINHIEEKVALITPMELTFRSELIYDVANQQFSKSRFNNSGCNTTLNLPDSIKPLFEAIISISADTHINELKKNHSKQNLLEALYLTNAYGRYQEHFNMPEYQLIRLKYGKEIPHTYLVDIVKEFPEYLI